MSKIKYVFGLLLLVPPLAAEVGDLKPVAIDPRSGVRPTYLTARNPKDFTKPVRNAGTVHPEAQVVRLRRGAKSIWVAIDADRSDAAARRWCIC